MLLFRGRAPETYIDCDTDTLYDQVATHVLKRMLISITASEKSTFSKRRILKLHIKTENLIFYYNATTNSL